MLHGSSHAVLKRDAINFRCQFQVSRRQAMPDMHADYGLSRAPPAAAGAGPIYTCPMHPQIRRGAPGHCPICGMTLEPEKISAVGRTQPRAGADDAPLLDRPGAGGAGGGAGDGRACDGPAAQRSPVERDPVCAGNAGCAVGRLALFRARLAVTGEPQPQHVHPDRVGNGRGLDLQRGGGARAADISRLPSA